MKHDIHSLLIKELKILVIIVPENVLKMLIFAHVYIYWI